MSEKLTVRNRIFTAYVAGLLATGASLRRSNEGHPLDPVESIDQVLLAIHRTVYNAAVARVRHDLSLGRRLRVALSERRSLRHAEAECFLFFASLLPDGRRADLAGRALPDLLPQRAGG